MNSITRLVAVLLCFQYVPGLSLRKDQTYVDAKVLAADDCDPSLIPVMNSFDIKKFSGKWFELAKTKTGYIDVDDGVWLIEGTNASHNFLFSGRDNNMHCIRPIKGKVSAALEPHGLLTLTYKTYSTYVEEKIRVLFTDYSSVAVIYSCMHHIHTDKEVCHQAGLFGAIWTRKPHVDVEEFDRAAQYLELACIHKSSLNVKNVKGPCRVDQWDFRIDDFPAPDYCYQVLDLGSCRGSLQRYYYEAAEKTCKPFNFGGCGGNDNNFLSLTECQKKCAIASNKDPVCMSTAKCGLHCSPCCTEDRNGCVQCDCEHIIVDNQPNCAESPSKCPNECDVENVYPGCYICNCRVADKIDELAVCNEVKQEGNCKASIERHYYDVVQETCEKFIYTGCGGNGNNFQTFQDCREKCIKDLPITQRSPEGYSPDDSSSQHPSLLLSIAAAIILLVKFQRNLF